MFSEPVGSLPLYTILIASHLLNPPYVCLEKAEGEIRTLDKLLTKELLCQAELPRPHSLQLSRIRTSKRYWIASYRPQTCDGGIFVFHVITTAVGIFVSIAIGNSSD